MKKFILVFLAFATQAMAEGKPSLYEPPDNKVLVFVGNFNGSYDSYRKLIPTPPTGLKYIAEWGDPESRFEQNCKHACPGAAIMVNYSFNGDWLNGNPRKAKSYVAEILAGEYDQAIDRAGRSFRDAKRHVFVILGNEFNLATTHSHENYIMCFRYIFLRWRAIGARNISYVWNVCPQITEKNYEQWYPGDAYVDWVSTSYYGLGKTHLEKGMGSAEKGLKEIIKLAKWHHKPFMIGECGPYGGSRQTWDSWYVDFFRFVKASGAKAITFNNQPELAESPQFGDERMQAMTGDVQKHWASEMAKSQYLHPFVPPIRQKTFANKR